MFTQMTRTECLARFGRARCEGASAQVIQKMQACRKCAPELGEKTLPAKEPQQVVQRRQRQHQQRTSPSELQQRLARLGRVGGQRGTDIRQSREKSQKYQ